MQPRGKKILIGCGLGCVVILLTGIASCVSVVIWLNRPGELLEPSVLLGQETTGYLEWTLRSEDPGTMEFAERLLDTVVEQQNRSRMPLPPIIDGWLTERQRRESEKDLNDLFPSVVAWTLRPGAAGQDDLHLISVSVASLGHRLILADWMLGFFFGWVEDIETIKHAGERIFRVSLETDRQMVFFIRRGTVFFTSDVDTSRRALDRLNRLEDSRREASGLERLFAAVPEGGPLRGALSNEHGELARLWDAWGDAENAPDWSSVTGLTLSGGFTGSDSLRGVLELHAADADRARELAPRATEALRAVIGDFPMQLEEEVLDRRVAIRYSIDDIPQRLQDLIDRVERGRRPGS